MPTPAPPTTPAPTPAPTPVLPPPATAEDVQAALKTLGLSEEKLFFEGCLRETDIIAFYLTQGESCCLIQDSEGYGVETWFFFAGENIEDISKADEYLGEYELPDYQWEELADSLLSAEVTVTPDVAEVVPPAELEEKCAGIRKQLAELENKLAQMKQKKGELEDLLSGAKEEKEKLEAEMADLEDKKANCPNDIAALQEEIPVLERSVETMKEALQQSVWLWQECKSRHPSAPHRCNGYLDRVGLVYQKLQDLRRELAAKKEALNNLQQECVELDSRIHLSISPKIGELNSAIRKYEQDIEDLSGQISEFESKIKQIKERLRECIDELEEARKLEKQVEAARGNAGHAVDKAEEKIKELEERYEKFKERFPDGVYPGDVEKYREKIEEIKQKIEKSATELDEEEVDKAKDNANDLSGEVEREKARLRKYWQANICIDNCFKAHQLRSESVEKRRDTCGSSGNFTKAVEALTKLKECCDRAKKELSNGNVQDAREICRDCLYIQKLAMAVDNALKNACAESATEALRNLPGVTEEEDLGEEAVKEILKEMGLLALEVLGDLTKGLAKTLRGIETLGKQQYYACCALKSLQSAINEDNELIRQGHIAMFLCYMARAGGRGPLALAAGVEPAVRALYGLSSEERRLISEAIQKVLRSDRCKGYKCP